MIRMFRAETGRGLIAVDVAAEALWIDLVSPDPKALAEVAETCGIRLPDRADMEEIELSSRLYTIDGTDYLTLVLPALTETASHQTLPVTFALAENRLITIRYHAPRPFQSYPTRAARSPYGTGSAQEVLYGILDEIIDRLADILEAADRRIQAASERLHGGVLEPPEMRAEVAALGRAGSLVSDVRNSLVTIERAVNFLGRTREGGKEAKRSHRALKVLLADAQSLGEQAAFINQKLALHLDVAFGMTTIQQNAVTKTFSLVAVLFLPPTLIGTIFGMNFAVMPWLASPWGFALALLAMVASSALSFLYFRWRHLL